MRQNKAVTMIDQFRKQRQLENRIEVLKGLILEYVEEENWDLVKLVARDLKQTKDTLSYIQ